jgi:uncharacterized protein YqcC (DUF446 family)
MKRVDELHSLLQAITDELIALRWWEQEPPPAGALASPEPFCCDTLRFEQWLQWVFIPRLHHMIAHQQPLPTRCEITPMGEESWRGHRPEPRTLLALLARIDELLSQPSRPLH